WLVARLAAEAFDRVEESGLLAADVGAGPAARLDVEGESLAHHVRAQQTSRARSRERRLDALEGQRIFTPDVDVALLAARRERGDRHRFDEGERILFHENAILERAGLRFVGVADEVVRARGLLRDGFPLPARRERGAAAAL